MPINKMNLDKLVSRTKIYLVIIAIILIVLSIIEPKAIIPSIILYILIVGYTIWSNKKRKAEISEHINELTLNVERSDNKWINVMQINNSYIWK